jgi:hypothetical protein
MEFCRSPNAVLTWLGGKCPYLSGAYRSCALSSIVHQSAQFSGRRIQELQESCGFSPRPVTIGHTDRDAGARTRRPHDRRRIGLAADVLRSRCRTPGLATSRQPDQRRITDARRAMERDDDRASDA